MRTKIYTLVVCIALAALAPRTLTAQNCAALQATCTPTESRCFATGTIDINATGGSGNYNYKVTGPVNTTYTSSNIINGLQAGTYSVSVKDIVTGCVLNVNNVVVSGSYNDPRFSLNKTDVVCMNGNDGSISVTGLLNGRSPFTYTIIAPSAMGVGTTNSTGSFNNLIGGDYMIQLKDSCGGIQTRAITILNYTWWIETATITRSGCSNGNVAITLKDSRGNLNTSGSTFNGYTYGYLDINGDTTWLSNRTFTIDISAMKNVTLVAKDNCGHVLKTIWTNTYVPAVAASVTISGKTCTGFNASVTGQANLTSPQYCLFDASNVQLTCNTTGVFNNLPYGSYSIQIKDGCYDTTLIRSFTQLQAVPSLGASVNITGKDCSGFDVGVTSATNLTSPTYCLFDGANVQLSCNSTGTFNDLPYGSYCIKMTDGCYDTTISRCFTVTLGIPAVGSTVAISNKLCAGFTATITGQVNLLSPQYCIYDNLGNQVSCNGSGVFNNLPYGNYCIQVKDGCYDTTITRCFAATSAIPAIGASVTISNRACSTYTATVTGQTNLTTPTYTLLDSTSAIVATNATGVFNNIPYGAYCIQMKDGCFDTTITRCFSAYQQVMSFTTTATPSCIFDHSNFKLTLTNGTPNYSVYVIDSNGDTTATTTSASTTINLNDLPNPGFGIPYTFIVVDACGQEISADVLANPSNLNHAITVKSKCPTGLLQNGSGDINLSLSTNIGGITPLIINKNGTVVSINYSSASGGAYSFIDLEPATYVLQYTIAGCSNKYYDTVVVYPYAFPNLNKSAAYQCDNNSFSLGASVNNGVGPFTYEIIGSNPSIPNINAGPQASPLFNINNGTAYSLIRLRATDACGNATLNDVSILPLANILVNTSSNCFFDNVTLSVDTIPNATYTWYKKTTPVDSTIIGASMNYNMTMFKPADTAIYVCKISVNSGCLTTISSFDMDGSCNGHLILPITNIKFTGKPVGGAVQLNWVTTDETNQYEYVVERSDDAAKGFTALGTVPAVNGSNNSYNWVDNHPLPGNNYYRIRIVDKLGQANYTKILVIDAGKGAAIRIYPNPAKDQLTVVIAGREAQNYELVMYSVSGQTIYQRTMQHVIQETIKVNRTATMKPGIYMLKVANQTTGDISTYKILFE